ncbi:hypothetical protein KM043_015548 [Ampulex compressa]|nr:hypothetical protein KM043_015548 [Ampulex compressa]
MKSQAGRKARDDENEMSGRRPRWFLPRRWRSPRAASLVGAEGEMKHSFTRALTARKVDFMMIITGERSKSGWPRAFHAGSRRPGLWRELEVQERAAGAGAARGRGGGGIGVSAFFACATPCALRPCTRWVGRTVGVGVVSAPAGFRTSNPRLGFHGGTRNAQDPPKPSGCTRKIVASKILRHPTYIQPSKTSSAEERSAKSGPSSSKSEPRLAVVLVDIIRRLFESANEVGGDRACETSDARRGGKRSPLGGRKSR